MSNSISEESALQLLPSVLARDKGMEMLAEITAKDIPGVLSLANAANVFGRIDELDDELLDLLAESLKVDWYQYDRPVSVKRNQIKSNWYMHRKLGTLGAVNQGLTDVWPPSYIEEWFEYGGDPYKFRIILDVSDVSGETRVDDALQAVRFYKPVRAHVDGLPIMKVSFGIIVGTASENAFYHVRAAGTEPRWATHGNKGAGQTLILSDAGASTYKARPCGTSLNALM